MTPEKTACQTATQTESALDNSFGDEASTTTTTTNNNASDSKETKNWESHSYDIAKREDSQVFKQKILVVLVLFLAAVSVSLAVFFITRNAESDEFDQAFQGGAEKIVASFEAILQEKIGSIGSLCLAFTARGKNLQENPSHAANQSQSSQHSWPWVTMDSFQERAASTRILSNVLHMSLLPIVTQENREAWEDYSVENGEWYAEGFAYQQMLQENGFSLQGGSVEDVPDHTRALVEEYQTKIQTTPFKKRDPRRLANSTEEEEADEEFTLFIPKIYEYTPYWEIAFPPANATPFAPVWQSAPVTALDGINLNIRSFPDAKPRIDHVSDKGEFALSGFLTASPGNTSSPDLYAAWYSELLSTHAGKPVDYRGDPLIEGTYPVFSDFGDDREVVAVMNFQFSWQTYFKGILPVNARGFLMVLQNACEGNYTYQINGPSVVMLGSGDLHDPKYDDHTISAYLNDGLVIHDGSQSGVKLNQLGCPYSVHIYPSSELHDQYHTSMPVVIALCVLLVFVFTAGMFFIYDRLVAKRNQVVVSTARQSSAIVQSLFPTINPSEFLSPNQRVKSFLSGGGTDEAGESLKPIADLFPHTTILFADIAGFTAWSSTRDPSQVFTLLQTVYGEFDAIAKRRKVFKVETIGDCYVAVTGLPNPQKEHAVIMARFAGECHKRLLAVVKKLEVTLGPDTTELDMRFGLHSGSVTAGVLRGERARFQLFGDTVNTASRMESTGKRSMIQASHTTASLLLAANKGHWLESREDAVLAKGKGVLNTFWVFPSRQESDHEKKAASVEFARNDARPTDIDREALRKAAKTERLVQWMTDLLLDRLRHIVARRKQITSGSSSSKADIAYKPKDCPLSEVVEAIKLPEFEYNSALDGASEPVVIPDAVVSQLRDHVAAVAARYNANPFHNFEHACHVTMSVSKLLGRVVAPEIDIENLKGQDARKSVMSHIHDFTHGINSDPLTLFGIVYSALIHDLDHQGISNTQLMKEDPSMATLYHNKSLAEQHSLDLAWELLMDDTMAGLRSYLFGNDRVEVLRFRQVVVNVVLATDIFDKELNDLRKLRWSKAFSDSCPDAAVDSEEGDTRHSLRATIVLEHIMQASDVSHTMQHWHIYQKWNRLLFFELYNAYKQGRMGANPANFWYQGELGFFDNYIIPLAKKLAQCGVFGVSSAEYLTYALQNRAEWEARGKELVQTLVAEAEGLQANPVPVTFPLPKTLVDVGAKTSSTTSADSVSSSESPRPPVLAPNTPDSSKLKAMPRTEIEV